MGPIIGLGAVDYADDKRKIEEGAASDSWFILKNDGVTLDAYLTNLYDNYELKNTYLSPLKICRDFSWPSGAVTVIDADDKEMRPASLEEFLNLLTPGKSLRLVVENDDRSLLANIAQQLIYLSYPLDSVDMKLRREFRDAERVRNFTENIDALAQAADEAVRKIEAIQVPPASEKAEELRRQKSAALTCYRDLREQIDKARKVEMKVAVAASKKTGKSVIVNCLIGEELAPTSLETATPNSCIYSKSPDDNYHLIWDRSNSLFKGKMDQFKDGTYKTREEIRHVVRESFKDAQKDSENKYLLPDARIEYVSDGNNFESYTIYDTPGPDAAGTAHKDSAEKAMQVCDASIFAIDYSKYLTDTEIAYLETVKEIFKSKNKFHSLLFTINKIDMALQDSGAKSRVKSIDFIRNRLIDIDPKYGDCIIFATSAQDFFNTITIREGAKKYEVLGDLMGEDADWSAEFRRIKKQLKGELDDVTQTALTNLGTEAERLEDLQGYESVNLRTIEEFSGMPALMSYLAYVLQGKAREEIINYIAVIIDAQTGKLAAIINQSGNLTQLLGKNSYEIERIREILGKYQQTVESVLDGNITEKDKAFIGDGYLLEMVRQLTQGSDRRIGFYEILSVAHHIAQNSVPEYKIIQMLWNQYEAAQFRRLKKLAQSGMVDKSELALPKDELDFIIYSFFSRLYREQVEEQEIKLQELGADFARILQNRFRLVNEAGEACQKALEKENCHFNLPELPAFDIALPSAQMPRLELNLDKVTEQLQQDFASANVIQQIIYTVLQVLGGKGLQFNRDAVSLAGKSDEDLKRIIGNGYKAFCDTMFSSGIIQKAQEMAAYVGNDSIKAQQNLLDKFYLLNKTCGEAVAEFMQILDDRKKFEKDSSELRIFLEVLEEIKMASERFISLWSAIRQVKGLPGQEAA